MPELPDIVTYVACLEPRIVGATLEQLTLKSPFVLRSVAVPPDAVENRRVRCVERLGKRIVLELEGDKACILHLMIAGRLQWKEPHYQTRGRNVLALFSFDTGTLVFTEASRKQRASLHLVEARSVPEFDPGGAEPMEISLEDFRQLLDRQSHTLKRTLTDPRILSGIGNAYSDEILHRAGLSPFKMAARLSAEEAESLHRAMRSTLAEWVAALAAEVGDGWPAKVTAFRPEMAVHGKFGQPCPRCSTPVQRIAYAENEANYCPTCQTGGKLLADRALSRVLKKDWPKTLEALERTTERLGRDRSADHD